MELSEAAVRAAQPFTTDNITAMMLPVQGKPGDLIAVADGNADTAEVADVAIKTLRDRCLDKVVLNIESKGEEYHISLKGDLVKPDDARAFLDGLAAALRESFPDKKEKMAITVSAGRLVITNPTDDMKSYLDGLIKERKQRDGRE
jgi:hypothetical protein